MTKTSGVAGDALEEGPMWNTFWNSTFAATGGQEYDRVSQHSESRFSANFKPTSEFSVSKVEDDITPELSVSQRLEVTELPAEFSFKLRDMMSVKSKIYRFRCSSNNIKELYEKVCSRTKYTSEFLKETVGSLDIVGPESTRLSYLDDEGDVVSIESDLDLEEAVTMALSLRQSRLVIFLGEPPSRTSTRSSTPNPAEKDVVYEKQQRGLMGQLFDLPPVATVAISAGIVVASFYALKTLGSK